jgi:[ribosomal protein S5]-alanine N-acetyltransferase
MKIIHTPWLKLLALSREQLQLLLTDLPQVEHELGVVMAKDIIDAAVIRAITIKLAKMSQSDPAQHLWLTYWLLVITDKTWGAGLAGFKGIPDEKGETEIGYGISSTVRRQGYMTEAVQALITWAFAHKECQTVVALDVLRSNIASQRVLSKAGLHIYQETAETLDWRLDKNH